MRFRHLNIDVHIVFIRIRYFNSSMLRGDAGHNVLPGCRNLVPYKTPKNIRYNLGLNRDTRSCEMAFGVQVSHPRAS